MDRTIVLDPEEASSGKEPSTECGNETARRRDALQEIASQIPEIGDRFRRLAEESARAFARLPD